MHAAGEATAVARGGPFTVDTLLTDLRALDVQPGMSLLVHSSLSQIGWVAGGAQAVILALMEAVSPEGTLVMPTFTNHNSDPAHWQNPPVPEAWWPIIRAEMPAYDRTLSPTRMMGAIAETFRSGSGVIRSDHPVTSFAAWGRDASRFVGSHPLEADVMEGSPIAALYEADGYVLLLGVGYGNCTSLHLSEARANYPGKAFVQHGAAMLIDGRREWVTFTIQEPDDDDFEALGAAYEQAAPGSVRIGKIGLAETRLVRQRPLVDFGIGWLTRHRQANINGASPEGAG
jgi:aminoglycoside 3-N-acetyltransferase